MQTKCTNCGTISPLRTDICDKCGGMSFTSQDDKDTRKIGEIIDAKADEARVNKAKVDAEKKEIDEKAKSKTAKEEEKADKKKPVVKEDKKKK